MSLRTVTREVAIRQCDRCQSEGVYLTDVPDGVVAERLIDLCRACTDEVFPDLFKPAPAKRRRRRRDANREAL
jgi:hypothetical protein